MDANDPKKTTVFTTKFPANKVQERQKTVEVAVTCAIPCCFFCAMNEQDPLRRAAAVARFFREMPRRDDPEHVLVMSALWNVAMAQPGDPEFPSLGIFRCMAALIRRGLADRAWLLRDQNIYIPYYAAHIVGSYTIRDPRFAEIAIESAVVEPLMELLRGRLTWVEQRVAVRALGHLASYEGTFRAVARHEEEVVELAMRVALTCVETVNTEFVAVGRRNEKKTVKYQCDLLTRGLGGEEMENRKAEEWASQLQCWSLYLLSCFACKDRSHARIYRKDFLRELGRMWGGLVNADSPAGVGLMRILCRSGAGRRAVAECKEAVEGLCNLSRSSDDWQYMGIDCLLLLVTDLHTRCMVMEAAAPCLADLVEIRSLASRQKLGDTITEALLLYYPDEVDDHKNKRWANGQASVIERVMQQVWELKVERREREKAMPEEELADRRVLSVLRRQQGNDSFRSGDIEEAAKSYTEALDLCPLKKRKDRMVLLSNIAQCHLLLGDPDAAISDATRALSLSNPTNRHARSLWRRSQAYDMKGLAKESLMDCVMFVSCCLDEDHNRSKNGKVPYYAARMINKQMTAAGLFATVSSGKTRESFTEREDHDHGEPRKEQGAPPRSAGMLPGEDPSQSNCS
ncbi:hypothetical protein Taro_027471 [Colocasia esculenta]|uniref:ARM repeat N-terminal plant domain-containing protein n=1 Tax=Colocasia esculenta TaxID=4460 RepID=A0A843VE04_COLES|nr:hypothetical protein [Colocasia esculenta]